MKKLLLILTLLCNVAYSDPAPINFKMVDGTIYDITAPGSRWMDLHARAEVTGITPTGSIIRQFSYQPVRSREAKTTRAKVYNVGRPPGAIIRGLTAKVYGSTIFLFGHKLLIGQEVTRTKTAEWLAMPVGQANINGMMMEVWKTGTTPTIAQVREWQMKQQAK
jgi:hypothetical protein